MLVSFNIMFIYCILLQVGLSKRIAIIGAGPSGLLLAANILSSNSTEVTEVDIYESKQDPRIHHESNSFAIRFNVRANADCSRVPGLTEAIIEHSCSNMIHTRFTNGWTTPHKIAPNPLKTVRYLLTQPLLASAMLDFISSLKPTNVKLKLNFNSKCLHVDPYKGELTKADANGALSTLEYDLIVGSDGAKSVARNAISAQAHVSSEAYSTPHKWKFLAVDIRSPLDLEGSSGFFNIDEFIGGWWKMRTGKVHCLISWKPTSEKDSQHPKSLDTKEKNIRFLSRIIGEEVCSQLDENAIKFMTLPAATGNIVKLSQYHHTTGKVVLIGDAAHVMPSTLGQGMSTSMTDVSTLFDILQTHHWENLPEALKEYSDIRVSEGIKMTNANYIHYFRTNPIFIIQELIRQKIFGQKPLFLLLEDPSVPTSAIYDRYKGWIRSAQIREFRESKWFSLRY